MNIYIQQIISIALNNKYTKWYISIIQNSKYKDGYGEKHHILPKCFNLGGNKDPLNIVKLTAREHYVCHLLLTKMFSDKKFFQMNYALMRMTVRQNNKHERHYNIQSIFYEKCKIVQSQFMKTNNPNRDGKQVKLAWKNASKERRKSQAILQGKLNKIHKSKPKIKRLYSCVICNMVFEKIEFLHKPQSNQSCCSRSCNAKLTTKKRCLKPTDLVTRTVGETPDKDYAARAYSIS